MVFCVLRRWSNIGSTSRVRRVILSECRHRSYHCLRSYGFEYILLQERNMYVCHV